MYWFLSFGSFDVQEQVLQRKGVLRPESSLMVVQDTSERIAFNDNLNVVVPENHIMKTKTRQSTSHNCQNSHTDELKILFQKYRSLI